MESIRRSRCQLCRASDGGLVAGHDRAPDGTASFGYLENVVCTFHSTKNEIFLIGGWKCKRVPRQDAEVTDPNLLPPRKPAVAYIERYMKRYSNLPDDPSKDSSASRGTALRGREARVRLAI